MQNAEQTTAADQIKMVTSKVTAIVQELPELPAPTSEQQQARRNKALGPKKLDLLDNRLEEAKQNKKLLPPSFDLAQLEEQIQTVLALVALLTTLEQVRQKVSAALLVLGHPAYVNAQTAMTYIKVASASKERLKPTALSRKVPRTSSSSSTSPPVRLPEPIPATGLADGAASEAA